MQVAIIGCGRISKAHIDVLQSLKSVEICGVCDQDKYRAAKVASSIKTANAYTDCETLLRQEHPDAVHILTPPRTHPSLAIQVMEAGCHVLVEKPMALFVKDADEMLATARANHVRLCATHNYLFKPCIMRARSWVESDTIGEVLHVDSFYGLASEGGSYLGSGGHSHWASRLPGGSFSNFLPHLIYLQLEFLQQVDEIAGVVLTPSGTLQEPTELHVLLKGGGVSGNMTISTRSKPYAKFINIYGTRGGIHADLVREICTLNKDWQVPRMISKVAYSLESSGQLAWGTVTNTAKVLTGRLRNMPGLQELVRQFYTSIEEDCELPVSGEDGREVARIMEMIWEKSGALSGSPSFVSVSTSSERPETMVENKIEGSNTALGKVLVSGAAGFLGHHLVAALSRCGQDVVALVRDSRNVSPILKKQATIIDGDLRDRESIETSMRGIDIVFHCAAITTNQATWEEHRAVNIKGTEMILREALKANVKRVIYASSVIVYGLKHPTNGRLVQETDPYAKNPNRWAHYMRSKIEAEKVAFQFMNEYDLPITIIRLGLLYGPGGGRPPGHGLVHLGHYHLFIGRGRNRLPYTYVGNAIDCLLLSALLPEAVGQVYNVVDDPQIATRNVAKLKLQIEGEVMKPIPLPSFLFSGIANLFELRAALRGSKIPPKISNYVVCSACRDIPYDTGKVRQQLGWRPAVTLEEGLRRMISPSK
jgi:nucleoside-diphosphate-sugar epimerase/predicted dehydrogenase